MRQQYPKFLRTDIAEEDIKGIIGKDKENCVLANALKRTYSFSHVQVSLSVIRISGVIIVDWRQVYHLEEEAYKLAALSDAQPIVTIHPRGVMRVGKMSYYDRCERIEERRYKREYGTARGCASEQACVERD